MEKRYHKGQELTMSELGLSLEELSNQPLELLAREGAKLVLAVALEKEITEFLQCQRYERHSNMRRGYRNGHRERQLSCGAGEVESSYTSSVGYQRGLSFSVGRGLATPQ